MKLSEKYRPRTWAELIGQDKAVSSVRRLIERGLGGRTFWISGASGTGKTSMAYLIASEIADSFYVQEIDASDLTIAKLKEIEESMSMYGGLYGSGKSGRGFIVNEAHGLRRDVVRQLLVLLERLPAHAVMIFTTTIEGQQKFEGLDDSSPLLSRCHELRLTSQGLAPLFAQRAREIAVSEGLDGQGLPAYLNLVKEKRNNMRAVLSEIEGGRMAKE